MLFRTHVLPLLTIVCAALALAACSASEGTGTGPTVLAAASLQGGLEEVADAWQAQGHARPVLSFSASPALARQAAQGAPADIVITADAEWMDWLEERDLLRPETRRDVLGNRLVLVQQSGGGQAGLAGLQAGQKLALAEPESVPAGRYAKAALVKLGAWDKMKDSIVPAENVRAALALVERGQAELGIVYATDAMASDAVEIVAEIPPASHPPIRYPAAMLVAATHPQSEAFTAFLTSDEAQAIFASHGFAPAR